MSKRLIGATTAICIAAVALLMTQSVTHASAANPWKGEYFQNRTLSGQPATVRNDNVITFEWGYLPPVESWTIHENFSVRWTVTDTFANGTYVFAALPDDGIRMYVDGVRIIDEWYDQEHWSWHVVERNMTAGKHTVKVEYYQHEGWAQIQAGYYPKSAAVAGKTNTPGPSPTPTVTKVPVPTRTPSLFGTVSGPQPTAYVQPPPELVDPGSGQPGATPSPLDRLVGINSKSVFWEGFPGPATHKGGQTGSFAYVKNRNSKPTFRIQWNVEVDQVGYYDVYVYVPAGQNVTKSATYRIYRSGELSLPFVVDQSINVDQWVFMGSYYFVSGPSALQYIYLDNQTSEQTGTRNILLDAIRLVYRP